ncbi:MAG TPA: ABC-type transport auxiliary lipoprotein family protein [Candidatus Acidoferrum sp.]|nr:ABC-type transport auxiliary lipoprotein family protein [Candidatus Acidoferrum sp.]
MWKATKRKARLIAAAGCLIVVAGCGAARPVRYFTLVEQPPSAHGAADTAAAQPYAVSLLVARVRAAQLLEEDRIVYGMSPVEMGVYSSNRWAEPPPEMIETMLIERLRASGQYKSVQQLAGATRGNYIVRGRLISLEEMDSPSGVVARFTMELDLFDPKTGTVVWSQTYSHDDPVQDKTVNAVVEALQRNAETGLDQLVTGLGQYFASHSAH